MTEREPTAGEALLALLQGGGTTSSCNDGNHYIAAEPASQQPQDVKLKGEANSTDTHLGTPSGSTSKSSKKQKKKKGNSDGANSSNSMKQKTDDGPQASAPCPDKDSIPFAWSAFQSSPDPTTLPFPIFDSDCSIDLEDRLEENNAEAMAGKDMEHNLKKVLGLD